MLNNLWSVVLLCGILGLTQLLEASISSFTIKKDNLLFKNLLKLGRDYSKCSCGTDENSWCYEFTITVNRQPNNCSVYGFLNSENTTIPNETIDKATSLKYRSEEDASPEEATERTTNVAAIVAGTVGGVVGTGVAGYFLADKIKTLLQSNTYLVD